MPRIDPEGRLTRAERLVVVIALIAAVAVHLVLLFGWGRLTRWAEETEKKERLMVIRRVRDIAPRDAPPEPPRAREAVAGREGKVGGEPAPPPPPPKPQVKEQGEPPKESELTPKMEDELREEKPEDRPSPEEGEQTVSVVTDLRQASFTVGGPAEFRGSGTFWLRKGAPVGVYTATFHPVAGFATPPIQSKELVAKGQIVFVGKYKRSVEVVVQSDRPEASFTIYRPDGTTLSISRTGRVILDDLPPGNYTAVFKDLPGYITPGPVTRTLSPGAGTLSFFGEYKGARGTGGGSGSGPGVGPGTGLGGSGTGPGGGGQGRGGVGRSPSPPSKARAPAAPEESGLDRRVQIVVKSYPQTEVEESWRPIAYPAVVIRRSNFQRGWCQVYLIIFVDGRGRVTKIEVERPREDERPQYEALIATVEAAVREWDYDNVSAEVHVDARFYVE